MGPRAGTGNDRKAWPAPPVEMRYARGKDRCRARTRLAAWKQRSRLGATCAHGEPQPRRLQPGTESFEAALCRPTACSPSVREPEGADTGRSADGRAGSLNPEEQRPFRFRPFTLTVAQGLRLTRNRPDGWPASGRPAGGGARRRERGVCGIDGLAVSAAVSAAAAVSAVATVGEVGPTSTERQAPGSAQRGRTRLQRCFAARSCEGAAEPRGAGPGAQSRGHAGRARVEAQPDRGADRQQQPRGCKPSSGKKKYSC